MKLAMVGLGKMGANMVRRPVRDGHEVVALQMRFRSRQSPAYAGKVLNAMRAGFGGHRIKPAGESES